MNRAVFALAVALALPPVAADHIRLQSGEVLRGRVLEEKDDLIEVRLPFLTVTLASSQVKEVVPEPVEIYVQEVALSLLDSSEPDKARLFLAENHPSLVDTPEIRRLAKVAEGWAGGVDRTLAMEFDAADEAFRSALEAAPDDERILAARDALEETRAFVAERGYMPGEDRRHETRNFMIVHRHPKRAAALGEALEELLRPVEAELSAGENHGLRFAGKVVFLYRETPERYAEEVGPELSRRPVAVLSPYRVASYQGAAEEHLRPLVVRLAARHMYPVLPAWAEEGIALGALARKPEDVYAPLREAYAGGTAFGLEELLLVRNPFELPEDRRALFEIQSRAVVDFLSHGKGSKFKFRQILRDAEAAVTRKIQEMLKKKEGIPRVEGGLSLRNLSREEVVAALKTRYRYDDLDAMDREIRQFLGHGGK